MLRVDAVVKLPSDPTMLERAAALKHDLGKYVAWLSANFGDDAWTGTMPHALVEALQADVLRTRKRAEGDQPAWEIWAAHTHDLPRPLTQPELRVVETAIAVLREHEGAIRSGDPDTLARARPTIRRAQQDIRTALRDFHRRMLHG